ncbi:MAG: class I SAM-dependent methyltransferase [bacterium]
MRRLLRDFHDPGSITRRAHLLKALDGWGESRPGAVLDFGCGRGRHSFLVSSRWPVASVVGVDVDEEALDVARRRAAARGYSRLEFLREDAVGARGPFDLVICIDVLEHIADDLGVLRRIASVLKRRGSLILHTPSLEQRRYFGVAGADAEHAGGEEFGHVRDGYRVEALLSLVRDAGFLAEEYNLTVGRATAWLTDLDYRLARWRLHPGRVFTYLASRLAARREVRHNPSSGRGIMVVARRGNGREVPGTS